MLRLHPNLTGCFSAGLGKRCDTHMPFFLDFNAVKGLN